MTRKELATDVRHLPRYAVKDAAKYLLIPKGTLYSWVKGRTYRTEEGERFFEPVIERPDPTIPQLSFTNLVEAHVLRIIRKAYQVRLDKVRTALDYLEQQFGVSHPLSRVEFQTDGVDLFVSSVGKLINASQAGQLAMRETLKHLLQRIELDETGVAIALFPYTHNPANLDQDNLPKPVLINPSISFGRPILVQSGIPTQVLKERYEAGESMADLAEDYDCDRDLVEEAIRYELSQQQVA
jgi:uncharacterized protein (DUF433 family)